MLVTILRIDLRGKDRTWSGRSVRTELGWSRGGMVVVSSKDMAIKTEKRRKLEDVEDRSAGCGA